MELRWIDGPEAAETLNPIVLSRGWPAINGSSNPVLTRARVAFDDEKVVGFFVLQLFPMVGPVLIQDGPPELFGQMMKDMLDFLHSSQARGWLVVAENPKVAKLCEQLGMEQVLYPVYVAKGV